MNILLVKPPFARLLNNDVYLTYPLGLMYVAGMLKSRGHYVNLYHDDVSNPKRIPSNPVSFSPMNFSPMDESVTGPFIDTLDELEPDVVGISSVTADSESAAYFARICRERGIRVIGGGVHPSLMRGSLGSTYNAIVSGEGDTEAAADVFEDASNIYCKSIAHDLNIVNADRNCVIGGYRYSPFLRGIVQTQRGCPYSCGYCAAPKVFGNKMRFRDPVLVREEIQSIGITDGRIIDDAFGVYKKHSMAICEELSQINYNWICDIAVQDADDVMLYNMHNAGCTRINLGIESAVERWRKLSGKKFSDEDPERVLATANRLGIGVVFYFMVGFPGETYGEMMQTLHYAKHLKDLGASPCVSIATPYPKTQLWDMVFGDNEITIPFSQFIHQSSKMGFGDVSIAEWRKVLEYAQAIG